MVTSFIRRLGVVVVALLALATGAAYASTPTWTETRQHLPVDRESLDSYNAGSSDVDCVSASYCVVVGEYDTNDPALPYRGFLNTITGTGSTSIAAPLPANARSYQPILSEVSCPAAGQCVAVGSYTGGRGGADALVETQVAGRWVPQRVGVYPLEHVDCTTAVCAASGPSDISGYPIFAVREAGHGWKFPSLTPPAGATIASVDGVTCAGSACYAFGSAYPTGGGNRRSILLLPDGAGYRAVFARKPAGVPGPVQLTDMTCLDESTCYALGYTGNVGRPGSPGDETHLVLETLSGGEVQVQELSVPTNVGSDALVMAYQLSCASGGLCAATAVYGVDDPNYGFVAEGNILLTTGGHGWHAVTAPLPTGWPNSYVVLSDVSCASGSCVAVGTVGEHGARLPLVESYQTGTWTPTVRHMPSWLPDSAAGGLGRVSCARAGCLAIGGFDVYDSCTCSTAYGAFLARHAIKTQ